MFHLFLLAMASGFMGITICFAGAMTTRYDKVQRILKILIWLPVGALFGFGVAFFVAVWNY